MSEELVPIEGVPPRPEEILGVTKYDELCEIYSKNLQQFHAYRDMCFQFAAGLVDGLRVYLGAPSNFVNYYATTGDFRGRKLPGLTAAMILQDDGYFHLGVCVDMFAKYGSTPADPISYRLRIRRQGGAFVVVMDDDARFEFRELKDYEAQPFYDYIFNQTKNRFENALRDFLRTGDVSRRQGF